ncbi:HNH endonuclease signature motif containing protein [Jiangella muralis]|uniref:HNH endonuclease signature motif containing protein n=1 Tax=Jiangella muralis TaxID=702383 RepID=UPI00069EF544|nr:HNH endonuclease signature motif containing protein [Jiangella muralis]
MAGSLVWHPDAFEWVRLEPDQLLGDDIEPGFLERSARVLPVDAERVPTGAELAALLAAFDAGSADAGNLVEAAAGWARLAAWAAAEEARVLSELASRPELQPAGPACRSVSPVTITAVEVAARCQRTVKQAENLVGHAIQLVEDFPDTHAALSAGSIDLRRARVITDELGGQDPAVRARVEADVLPEAPVIDAVALRKLIKRRLHQLAPVETAERHRIARDGRYVAVTPASDGMAFLEALLPAEDATALNTVVKADAADAKRADAAAGLPARSNDQRRADALAELAWDALAAAGAPVAERAGGRVDAEPARPPCAASSGPAAGGVGGPATVAARGRPSGAPRPRKRRSVTVHVTVPFSTLAGLDDQPGELDGYGPIPAHVARALAAEGVWTWLRTDPETGQLLDLGRRRYRPTAALAAFVTARDRTCRMPGCHQPARAADIDHVVPFAAGGPTSRANLQSLCEAHHLIKHLGRWGVERQPGGGTRWASPTGHRYLKPPG